MFLGALLDGLPEAFILGIGIALGGGVSVAFVVAVFVSNVPRGRPAPSPCARPARPTAGSPGCGRR